MTRDDVLKIPPQMVPLGWISADEPFQLRVKYNQDACERYRQRYEEGGPEAMPPVVAVEMPLKNAPLSARTNRKGEAVMLYLVDGFHRYHAAVLAETGEIGAIILTADSCAEGETIEQLGLKLAMEFNFNHGAPYTQQDRRNAVAHFLRTFPNESYRSIAQKTGVSKSTVENIKKQMDEAAVKEKRMTDPDPETPKQGKPLMDVVREGRGVTCAFCESVSGMDRDFLVANPEETTWRLADNGKWYCSDECEELGRAEDLEKKADKILENAEDFSDADDDDDQDEDDQDDLVESSTRRIDAPQEFQLRRDPALPTSCRVCRGNVQALQDAKSGGWFVQCPTCRAKKLWVSTNAHPTKEEAIRCWNIAMGLIYHD